jgi:hypothetical protein
MEITINVYGHLITRWKPEPVDRLDGELSAFTEGTGASRVEVGLITGNAGGFQEGPGLTRFAPDFAPTLRLPPPAVSGSRLRCPLGSQASLCRQVRKRKQIGVSPDREAAVG